MSAQENKEFVRRYLDAISGKLKTEEMLDEYMTDQSLKEHIAGAEQAFPGYELQADQMLAEDDLVSLIGRLRGTHAGPLMGIPPTGKSFEVPIHITYRVEGDKIVDHWMLVDNAGIMQQLGLVPSASGAD